MYSLGKTIITDGPSEFGHEIEMQIERLDEEFEGILAGKVLLQIFDESDGNLFEQADSHSQYACNLVENVHVAAPYSDEWERAKELRALQIDNKVTYTDGSTHSVVSICGRLAVLSDVRLESLEHVSYVNEMLILVINKLQSFLNVDYILADKCFFIPDEKLLKNNHNTVKDKQDNVNWLLPTYSRNIGFLKEIGFQKTGKDGYVLKVDEFSLETA